MDGFVKCFLYLIGIGILFFLLGRMLPGRFDYSYFPFQSFRFERNGEIYNRIYIRTWQNKLPDMSKLCSAFMPRKKMPEKLTIQNIEEMIQETCIAELIHTLLCIAGFGTTQIWKGTGGWILFILYVFGNLPFICVQRYNRPKLVRVLKRLKAKAGMTEQENTYEESLGIELQHRAGA